MSTKMKFLDQELSELEKNGLYRRLRMITSSQEASVDIGGKRYLSFCSNNYLGLSTHPTLIDASVHATHKYGCGAGASRLISGTMQLHSDLEDRLAKFEEKSGAVLFTTGYCANIGAITSLVNEEDTVILDRFNHASIVDAARLSRAKFQVYPHKDMEKLEKILKRSQKFRRRLIVTDGVFSMDGDLAPLPQIVELAHKYQAYTMVDEAHGTGVIGAKGRGVCEHFNLENKVDIIMGTLSKAVGSLGGFVVGETALIEFLRNKARSFIYTTALPPAVCAASIAGLNIIEKDRNLRKEYWEKVNTVKLGLQSLGFNLMETQSHIIPVLIKDALKTMEISKFIYEQGILIPAIRIPTVPRNTNRLRISLMATHTPENIDTLLNVMKKVKNKFF